MLTSNPSSFFASHLKHPSFYSSWNSALAPWPEAYADVRVSESSAARR